MKLRNILVYFYWLIAFMLLLVGCGVPVQVINHLPNETAVSISSSFNIATHKVSLLPCNGLLVVDSTVSSTGSPRWNTPNGKKPSGSNPALILRAGYYIYVPVQFSHMHILLDHRTQQTLEFITLGGQVGQDTFSMQGYPSLLTSQRYLVVFTAYKNPQTHISNQQKLVVYDAYPIDAQQMITVPAISVDEGQVGPMTVVPSKKVPLSQFEQQFASCR